MHDALSRSAWNCKVVMKMILQNVICVAVFAFIGLGVCSPAAAQQDPLDEELDSYWSVDRDLPVIQDRIFTREGRFAAGIFVGLLSSEPFYWYVPVGAHLNYYFTNQLGIEIGGGFMDAEDGLTNTTELFDFLERESSGFDPATDLGDRFLWRANALFVWNPLYGKWSFLNNKLTHFDINLVAGGGVLQVERPNKQRTDHSTETVPEFIVGLGAHFLLDEHWIVRADGRFYVYPGYQSEFDEEEEGEGFFGRLKLPAEFQLGASYLF